MAGHSKYANIKHRKGAQDARRAKVFSKLGREITVAAKLGGADPAMNPRLRLAIATARGQSMNIKDTCGNDGNTYFLMLYGSSLDPDTFNLFIT